MTMKAIAASATMQGVEETIDPVLGPLLARAFVVRGKARMLRMLHREVEVAPGFRLALTTNLGAAKHTCSHLLGRRWRELVLACAHASVAGSSEFKIQLINNAADTGNPFFSAELVGQVTVVDCQVTAAGLTAQLAAAVVRAEQPTLAAQQSDLVGDITAGRRQQVRRLKGTPGGGDMTLHCW